MKNKTHVTIVDDSNENLNNYRDLFSEEFDLELIQDPTMVVQRLDEIDTNIVVLDLHMPQMNGFELYKAIKRRYANLPIIFLTGDTSEEHLIEGLKLGAEDFIVKPISLNVLIARIESKIAHDSPYDEVIRIGDFALDCSLQQAHIEGKVIQLTPIEFKFLYLLIKSPNKIFSREYISNLLWPNIHVQNQNIDTHLSNLRKKLQPFSKNIKTIKSRGYILRI